MKSRISAIQASSCSTTTSTPRERNNAFVLADHDLGDAIEQDGAAAHRTGRQRRVDGRGTVHRSRLSAGVFDRIHLAMQDGAGLLHTTIVATADDLGGVYQHRADRDAALA